MRLIDVVNNHITNPYVIDKRGRFAHYPSEARVISRIDGEVIGKCHRASWYNWMGETPTNPPDARAMWTFAMGSMIERQYVEYCKQIGIWAGNNVHFFDQEHNISGEADIFVWNRSTPEITMEGTEIKTAYGWGFQNSVSKFPKLENLMQAGIYLNHFPITCWHLVYHARDTQECVEYIITKQQDEHGNIWLVVDSTPVLMFTMQDIYNSYRILGEYAINKQLPPRDYTYIYDIAKSRERLAQGKITKTKFSAVEKGKATDSDWQCLYCEHLDRCWIEKRAQMKMKGGLDGVDSE